jgi:hypothetical protein
MAAAIIAGIMAGIPFFAQGGHGKLTPNEPRMQRKTWCKTLLFAPMQGSALKRHWG